MSENTQSLVSKDVENIKLVTKRREEQYSWDDHEFRVQNAIVIRTFFSNTIEVDLIDMSNYNYLNLVSKSNFFISKNEIKQTIRRCKSDNASKSNDILNRILKMLINKLMSHLVSLFRVCAELNYHFRCFRETHIIALKKFEKKNYTDVKTYKSIALLNILSKALESVIARRINDLAKTHDLLSVNQMKERKNRNCETILKLLTK